MTNDLIPDSPKSAVEAFIEKLNLPQLVAGPAGKAISRLVAGVIDVPAAYLDSFAQSIKNKTEARSLVSKEVATAAAKLASSDSDIIARAAHNLLAKEYRHQKNKEEIAKKTIAILNDEVRDHQGGGDTQSADSEVDEDWLNVFERYAQDSSSERLQNLWARILAGEIRAPKTFSLKTLRFVSELDQKTAQLFEQHVPYICSTCIFIPSDLKGQPFVDLMHLQDAGLISGVGGLVHQNITLDVKGQALFQHHNKIILIRGTPNHTIKMPVALLTAVGIEISRIIKTSFERSVSVEVANRIPKNGLELIAFAGFQPGGQDRKIVPIDVLWSKD